MKKVKMTQLEKDALALIILREKGLDEVTLSQIRIGAETRRHKELFWDGIYKRIGIPHSVEVLVDPKTSTLSWDDSKREQ